MDLFNPALIAQLHAPPANGVRMSMAARLAQILGTAIAEGMKTGDSFPPERDMATCFGVSRDTVRRAIDTLVRQGLVESRQGAGTFVAARVEQPLTEMSSFSDDMQLRGLRPGSHWLKRELRRPTPSESFALGLAPDCLVMHLERVRTADSVPMAIERSVLAAQLLGGNIEFGDSLYQALDAAGLGPVKAVQRLRASVVAAPDNELLGLHVGDPILHIERRSFSAEGRPLELTESLYRGDRYDYVVAMTRSAKGGVGN
ncbi:GntR family transcriptional regulator [Pseudoduganella lutea]|uniref:GntR family transcriptional regulator n=1 Tax=Pseudoduganella lutea TaxID=321985 RepID=A0A4P6KUF2_9BURK|nr:GntR family transcriptional regulator [Pseudoduganella lutea]QBE62739.1 GntR family transcriptional regulator [Pseudoduganella lutea]